MAKEERKTGLGDGYSPAVLLTCGSCGKQATGYQFGSMLAMPPLWGRGSVDGSLPVDLCGDCFYYPPGPTIKIDLREERSYRAMQAAAYVDD